MTRTLAALLAAVILLFPVPAAHAASATLQITWQPAERATGYRVYCNAKLLKDVGPATACTVRVVLPGNTRTGRITVMAYNAAGESVASDPVTFKIPYRQRP